MIIIIIESIIYVYIKALNVKQNQFFFIKIIQNKTIVSLIGPVSLLIRTILRIR
jgi:hypothetical protein